MFYLMSLCVLATSSCTHDTRKTLYLGQGAMVGEVTDTTSILQTRLTQSDTLQDGELAGSEGWVKFTWRSDDNDQSHASLWLKAKPEHDYVVKYILQDLLPNSTYRYQVQIAHDTLYPQHNIHQGRFRTLPGELVRDSLSLVITTGMNYYFFHYGNYDSISRYQGTDRHLGYPALASIMSLAPDYFVGTGDNVYFDHPAEKNYQRAIERGKQPLPGLFDGKEVTDEVGMRRKYHVQFAQPRFRQLFAQVGTYWEKDDHDYRVNDADPVIDFPISHELGIKNFREQLPVVPLGNTEAKTYRTHRLTQDVQIWLWEGRDYRSANDTPADDPKKSIWGEEQKAWLKETLMQSDAPYKLIISPTPMVGPDDASKRDNHVNPRGFRREGEEFFAWLTQQNFSPDSLFFVCGDRHWQYHAIHPSGFEEFSCGALVDANSRAGRMAGDPKSTDPESLIEQKYVQGRPEQATGGFLHITVNVKSGQSELAFNFYDEKGQQLYSVRK